MGFHLMRAAQRHGRDLDANAFKALLAMADRAKDADPRPCYFGGHEYLADFLPEVLDSAKDPHRAREEKVRRAVKALVAAGLVRPLLPASQVHDSTYQRYDLSALLQSPTASVGHVPHGDRGARDELSPTPGVGQEPHGERAKSPTPGVGRRKEGGSNVEEVVGGDADAQPDDTTTTTTTTEWELGFDPHGAPFWQTPEGDRAPVDETRRARYPHLPDWALRAPGDVGRLLLPGWLADGGPADHAEQVLAHDPTPPGPATVTGRKSLERGWPIDIDHQDNDRMGKHVRAKFDRETKIWWVRDIDWFDTYWRLLGSHVLDRCKHDPDWGTTT